MLLEFENVWVYHNKFLRLLWECRVETLRHWEKGQREPSGSARALLLVADKQPKALRKAFNLGLQNN